MKKLTKKDFVKTFTLIEAMELMITGYRVAGEDWAEYEYIYYNRDSRDVFDEENEEVHANTLLINIDSSFCYYREQDYENN